MAPPAAIANAVEDALGHLGVQDRFDADHADAARGLLQAVIRSGYLGGPPVTNHGHHLRPVLAAGRGAG